MRETCFLLAGNCIVRVYFGTATRIPDSRERWDAIWQHRDTLTEIAHTHPGGSLAFSAEDLSTMEAVEAGLGKPLRWSVTTRTGYRRSYRGQEEEITSLPWWLPVLRKLSYNPEPTTKGDGHVRATQHHLRGPERQLSGRY